jgi:hypothetical protein
MSGTCGEKGSFWGMAVKAQNWGINPHKAIFDVEQGLGGYWPLH